MTVRCPAFFACSLLLALVLAGAGCTSTEIGDVAYSEGSLAVQVDNSGEPVETYIQVTVYEIRDFHQDLLQVIQEPVLLRRGESTAIIPMNLNPGQYKLYVYVLKPGERQTAAIRDIVV